MCPLKSVKYSTNSHQPSNVPEEHGARAGLARRGKVGEEKARTGGGTGRDEK